VIEIQLIVTGDMERIALADSLQRYFPGAHFRKPQKDECDLFTPARALEQRLACSHSYGDAAPGDKATERHHQELR
jgi:hypothetical protein